MNAVTAVERSKNEKTGLVSATYAAQVTCPAACPLRGSGCYAESGHAAFTTNRLNRTDLDAASIADAEASAIRGLTGQLPLRVHVVGDCASDYAAQTVSAAMADHEAKAGQPAWTYTHGWRTVDRASWKTDHVLASCESTADVRQAWEKGYSAAIVVDHFVDTKAYSVDGLTVIPCPQQTGKAANCNSCRLCMNGAVANRIGRAAIGFAVHGAGANKAKQAIRG